MSIVMVPKSPFDLMTKFILLFEMVLVIYSSPLLVESAEVIDFNNKTVNINSSNRIVSLNGSNTEILFALGVGDRVVGCDLSSTYPPKVKELPNIGYQYRLNAEGILALKPDLVIGRKDAKPPQVISQLRAAGVSVLLLEEPRTFGSAKSRIKTIGQAVDKVGRSNELINLLQKDLLALQSKLENLKASEKKKGLFMYLRGPQTALVLGKKTGPGAMLELSGAINCSGKIENSQPMTAEAVVAAKPDVLVLFESGLKSIGGIEGLLKLPGLAQTPAGRNQRVVSIDGLYLSGFGVRSGRAALELFQAIYETKGFHAIQFVAESED